MQKQAWSRTLRSGRWWQLKSNSPLVEEHSASWCAAVLCVVTLDEFTLERQV